MISKITLLGSSSGRNAGDAALIAGIMQAVDERMGRPLRYEIPTINPNFIRTNYAHDVEPISMLPWSLSLKMLGFPTWASMKRTDLSLIFDAVLFDRALYNPLFNYMSTLRLLLPSAKRNGKALGCYNVGIGPVDSSAGRRMLKYICEIMDFITVRDSDSLRILRESGVANPRIVVTADAALNVRPCPLYRSTEILRSVGIEPSQEVLALNVSAYLDTWAGTNKKSMGREAFVRDYSEALKLVAQQVNTPMLFVCTQHHDVSLSREIMERTRPHLKPSQKISLVSNRTLTPYEIKGVLSQVALLFGMRLHAIILASSELTPVAALPHQPKVLHYLRTLGLESLAMSFEQFSPQSLAGAILSAWESRQKIRETLIRQIPIQRERAAQAAEFVCAIHKNQDLDALVDKFKDYESAESEPKQGHQFAGNAI